MNPGNLTLDLFVEVRTQFVRRRSASGDTRTARDSTFPSLQLQLLVSILSNL